MKQYNFWYKVGKRHRSTYIMANSKQEAIQSLKDDAKEHGKIATDFQCDLIILENGKEIRL